MRSGGGFGALVYAFKKARQSGGLGKMYKALRTKNACKTCALGMGGQLGGMVNEEGRFPEVCKKSIQAMAADMQGQIDPKFFEKFSLEELGAFSPRELESSGRLVEPVAAGPGDTHYRPISWDDAFDRIAGKLKATKPEESFFYFSGRSSNEAGFLLQLLARLYGTNNVNNCSYYCHQASGVGLASVLGSSTATIELSDLDHCDLVFLIGANPSSNHPRLMSTLVDLRRRGGKVVVINPIKEPGLMRFRVPSKALSLLFGSKISDIYLQPHAGGDVALLVGIAKRVLESDGVDSEFVERHTEGWDELRRFLEGLTWEEIKDSAGIDRDEIDRVTSLYLKSRKTVFCWAMGVTHHANGVENVQAIANLAMVRGMLGKPHCGLLPLRGHSNVQGIGSMGVVPNLKETVLKNLEQHFGVSLPTWKGKDTLACIDAAHAEEMRFALCLGGNLFGSNPDSNYAKEALSKVDTVVYLSTTLNTGHSHGRGKETIILPVLARDEESQATTQESMFSYVRLSDGGPKRHVGPRSEVEVTSSIAARVFDDPEPIDWKSLSQHREIRRAIAHIVPGYGKIGDIDKSKQEFLIEGRKFHEPVFPTESGRARFHVPKMPPEINPRKLRLITVRSEGQFNTVVYEDEDKYRGQSARDVILLNPHDISRLWLLAGQRVNVTNDKGVQVTVTLRPFDVRPGNAVMYYPEANVLVPRTADPDSRTPAFKNTAVTVEASTASATQRT